MQIKGARTPIVNRTYIIETLEIPFFVQNITSVTPLYELNGATVASSYVLNGVTVAPFYVLTRATVE